MDLNSEEENVREVRPPSLIYQNESEHAYPLGNSVKDKQLRVKHRNWIGK